MSHPQPTTHPTRSRAAYIANAAQRLDAAARARGYPLPVATAAVPVADAIETVWLECAAAAELLAETERDAANREAWLRVATTNRLLVIAIRLRRTSVAADARVSA